MTKLVQIYVEGVSQEQLDDAVENLQDQIDALGGNSILAPTVVDGDTTHAPTGEAVFEAIKVVQNDVDTHEARVDNPHSVTKAQVGLGNVDNTSDINKPVSNATQAALNGKQDFLGFTPENIANKGQANGYVPLNGSAQIAQQYLPSYVDDVLEYANLAAFPVTGETGKIYVAIDTGKQCRWTGSVYLAITNGFIASTDDVPEGSTNKYSTNSRVLAYVLTGLSAAASRVLPAASDSLITAWGKVLKYLTDLGGAAFLNVGTSSGTVAAGDDSRIKGFTVVNAGTGSPADATTYYIGSCANISFTIAGFGTNAKRKFINKAGVITSAQIYILNSSVDGSTENSTFSLRLNDTTDYLLSNTVQFSNTVNGKVYNITGLSIAISAGDYIVTKFLTPTWTTNPTGSNIEVIYYVE